MSTCANGAESWVKADATRQGWRLAFSRPGFVTLKHDDPAADLPSGIFIRRSCHSIGSERGSDSNALIAKLADDFQTKFSDPVPFRTLHVWSRDRLPIGKFGFEPELDALSDAVGGQILAHLPKTLLDADKVNGIADAGATVMDVVLVEPNQWFWGWHVARDWHDRWPGGIQPIRPQVEPVSRAYFKAAESIAWSGFELRPGDLAVDVGSSPGGASGLLLEMGLRVLGIDPAEMDPSINEHPNFQHVRARAGDLKRSVFSDAKWMMVDSNVKPDQTLSTVENIVTHPRVPIEGVLLTLKLGNYAMAENLGRWLDRIRSWGPKDVQVRQLTRNRCEVCCAIRMR
ncbi:SAM-dependent methyltransferase [Crateriforma conspicua]|uniref:Putative 23S rRNA ribose 2'-O-ribose methyltransferase n=2 Tax=Crateriforma conspicua TaxID=2527996 RepID=A0A5C6FX38_9PLAN|nr:putative 23S rRNA ribose 2'-O-ribose methyltransferase [Crateriforma conspicua]